MTWHLGGPLPGVLAPPIAGAAGLLLRLGGRRRPGRPALRFAAGAGGLIAGWMVLAPSMLPLQLPLFAAGTLLAAACLVRDAPARPRGRAAPPTESALERRLALAAVSLGGGWWLGGGVFPVRIAAGAGAILLAALLVADLWSIAAAAVCLGAAALAVGAPPAAALAALVVAGACLGAGPLLPLAAGLGGAMAALLDHGLAASGRHVLAFAVPAPILCLLLQRWWSARFARFGRAADPVRALSACALVCALAFSAAAMAGLR